MKSSKEIKKELYEYIDSIDDEETLGMLHEVTTKKFEKSAAKTSRRKLIKFFYE